MKAESGRWVWFLGTAGLAVVGCSTGDAATNADGGANASGWKNFCELPPPCQQISQACMPKDDGTGPVHTCHMTGMVRGIQAECERDLSSCLTTCNAAPSFTDGPPEDFFAACRDGGVTADAGPLTFPVAALSTFTSDGKDLNIELRTAPDQPIHVGPDGQGQLLVTDAATGAPVDGLTIAVATWMPVMDHPCSPVAAKVEEQGQGVYLLIPLLASMKGECELKLTFSGARSEHAVSPTFNVTR